MKKNLKTLSFILILATLSTLVFFKFTGVESFAVDSQLPAAQTSVPKDQLKPQNALSDEIKDAASIPLKKIEGSEMEKTGFKDIVVKFLIAMFGVLVSSLAIFLGLKFYKNFILKNNSKADTIDYNKTLESPKDLKEAINIFLKKTDK